MANQQISYTTRDFQGIRQELINYVKQYYPELIDNFNDASVFSVLMDLNAAVADNLHFHIDRSIQETVLQYAQQRSSVYNIARTYGLKIPGQRPSVSLTDFSITVPAFGDKEDERYLGVLRRGSQVYGAGQVFENITDIDFASPFNAEGFPNRLKIPNFDANNNLINYTIVKREIVVNGITKVFKRVITPNDVRPFFELFLPERNVLGVTSIIQRQGTNYSNVPSASEFLSPVGKWYEVDALADNRVFIADVTKASDQPGIKVGKYIQTEQRFITEYTSEGFMKLTFGGGTNTAEDQLRQFTSLGVPMNLAKYQNNFALGTTPQPNTTMFIQYRVGGGLGTNLGINTINTIGTVNFFVNGPSESINTQVINSLRCNNVTAAIGGAGYPTTDEVRNFVTFNFASQNRAVTVADYQAIIQKMPSEFGAPAKVAIVENDNKINIQIVSFDTNGSLTEVVSNTLKQNLAEYLSNYRMMNDYVSVQVANVIDLSLEIEVILDATQNQGSVITNIVDKVYTEHFNPLSRGLGDNVYLANIMRTIQNENGVINVGSIKFFNLVGGQYSSSQTSQPFSNSETKQIGLIDGVIFAQPNQIYQVRFPEKDILVRVKNYTSTTIS